MKIRERYQINKKVKVGEECICPSCKSKFIKNNYQQIFCKTKPKTSCKDKYWNTVDPNKRNNTTRRSSSLVRWLSMKNAERQSNTRCYLEDQEHPFSSEALGQW